MDIYSKKGTGWTRFIMYPLDWDRISSTLAKRRGKDGSAGNEDEVEDEEMKEKKPESYWSDFFLERMF